jgi:energy-coupling factor transporter ATP-binding protein EcfA2
VRKTGIGVVFITHNVRHALAVGDRFTVLNRGKTLGTAQRGQITPGGVAGHDGRRAGAMGWRSGGVLNLAAQGLRDGFGIQRVFTEDGSLDETMAVHDHDLVLVPKGHHPCGAPYGVEMYYLNVMAGPRRNWRFQTHPAFERLMT